MDYLSVLNVITDFHKKEARRVSWESRQCDNERRERIDGTVKAEVKDQI